MRDLFERLFVPGAPNDCWFWLGPVSGGRAHFTEPGKRATTAARIAWRLYKGDIPDGMHVLHRCDQPLCVNVAHLWLGTRKDNMRDMAQKNRHAQIKPRGQLHGNAKLTDSEWEEIKQLRGCMTTREIAKAYGVTQAYVSHIQLERYKR